MIFRKNEEKRIDVNIETLKLRTEMVEHLLRYRFTWEEIERGLGFSRSWYEFAKKIIQQKQTNKI